LGFLLLAAATAVAFANGANDNGKGVATLLGAGILGRRSAIAWATLTTFAGSSCAVLLAGALMRRFSGKGLVPDSVLADPVFLTAVAAGAAGTVLLATRFGVPVSTTHVSCGALFGIGAVTGKARWRTIGGIFAAWIGTLPLAAALAALAALLLGSR